MGATSIVVERVLGERMDLDQTLSLDYEEFVESLGRDVIGSRTRNATLGLSTIKSAIRKFQRSRLVDAGDRVTV